MAGLTTLAAGIWLGEAAGIWLGVEIVGTFACFQGSVKRPYASLMTLRTCSMAVRGWGDRQRRSDLAFTCW